MTHRTRKAAVTFAAAALGLSGTAVALNHATKPDHVQVPKQAEPVKPPHLPGPVSGTGIKNLGKITVPRAGAEIRWTSSARTIVINTKERTLRMNPRDKYVGYRFIPGGTYHRVTVLSKGHWNITFQKRLVG